MQNNYVILLPLDFSLSTEKLTFRLKAPFDRSLVSLQFLAFSKASLISSFSSAFAIRKLHSPPFGFLSAFKHGPHCP